MIKEFRTLALRQGSWVLHGTPEGNLHREHDGCEGTKKSTASVAGRKGAEVMKSLDIPQDSKARGIS